MRLKSIKLAGFKSFVDPTTVHFPSNLNAVVGPNGCGKSNIIDAVRWVMGESSIKHLRGESMADVIFSGSNARAPVGQASIELIFDNSDGTLVGEYGAYSEISVKRTVNRELNSTYYLNGSRCRRRDIVDIFLGTGLGPRSYSIIEQGMISRFIEAKPEELRVYIEEAAGISKYKERRRETENRIRHTRENLERLTDIREELTRQLNHLQRQAKAAEQYSEYKKQERQLKAELQTLHWIDLDTQIKDKDQHVGQLGVELEAKVADQRAIETNIEGQRERHNELNEVFSAIQGDFYSVGTEIAKQEQSILHQEERAAQLKGDLVRILRNWEEAKSDQQSDQAKIEQLSFELAEVDPEFEALALKEQESKQALEAAEADMQQWQTSWDAFNQQAMEPRQQAEVQQSRIQHLEQGIDRAQQRIQKLANEIAEIHIKDVDPELKEKEDQLTQLDENIARHQSEMSERMQSIEALRDQHGQQSKALDQARRKHQEEKGRSASLQALQQAALGQKDKSVVEWLESHQLQKHPRLAEAMQVEAGWERAVEAVVGHALQAVCVDDLEAAARKANQLHEGRLTLLGQQQSRASDSQRPSLLTKVQSSWNLSSLLGSVSIADTLDEALNAQSALASHESIVTREGIWVGPGWVKIVREEDAQANVLGRQQELNALEEQLDRQEEELEQLSADVEAAMLRLKQQEQQRDAGQQALSDLQRQRSELAAGISARRTRLEQQALRRDRLVSEQAEQQKACAEDQEKLTEARQLWQKNLTIIEMDANRRQELEAERDEKHERLGQARERARHYREQTHELALKKQSASAQLSALEKGMERLSTQVHGYAEQQEKLEQALGEAEAPIQGLKQALEQQLEQRLGLENKLKLARQDVEQVEQGIQKLEQERGQAEQAIEVVRNRLQEEKLQWQGLQVQRETIEQQLIEANYALNTLLESLSEEATEEEWERQLQQLQNRIQRLGPINLAAIDEFKTQSERKSYLDAQNEDLEDALGTLENAIQKIDRETRTKFKETFDRINKGIQSIFPKVFGGGHAYIEMTGDDLLSTGVAVMARPPGKRNTTIHLLSGGEKALTAISMVFAIFQLNPAPFCMLDEVDAPLDDANVSRFCRIVEEMSEKVQFIFITHNKVTMEMAHHMMGVTMQEPGVSRLVSVDVEEAAVLAAS